VTRLSDFLDREIGQGSFPGGVALAGNSEEILEVAFAGLAAVEPREEPTTPDTLYDLASLTKPLASGALAVALPALALGAPPGRYFHQWKKTRYEGITIEMLMTHTSGLPAWYPLYARGEGGAAYRRTLGEIEPEARPGERVIYSDLNFLLLGEILESLYSAPLDRSFADLVARPAGSGARFLPPSPLETAATEKGDVTERAMTAALSLSYAGFRTEVVRGEVHDGNAFRRGGVAGNAGLFGNATDVWALARVWLRDFRSDVCGDRTPDLAEARGLAWQGARGAASVGEELSRRAFGHTGFTGTSLWIDPEAQRIWVLLTNRVHPTVHGGNFNEIRRRFHAAATAAFPA
jgi:serine-type D-Ala-D-Ala carboxypeptidase